jgi:hypothetical protein
VPGGFLVVEEKRKDAGDLPRNQGIRQFRSSRSPNIAHSPEIPWFNTTYIYIIIIKPVWDQKI